MGASACQRVQFRRGSWRDCEPVARAVRGFHFSLVAHLTKVFVGMRLAVVIVLVGVMSIASAGNCCSSKARQHEQDKNRFVAHLTTFASVPVPRSALPPTYRPPQQTETVDSHSNIDRAPRWTRRNGASEEREPRLPLGTAVVAPYSEERLRGHAPAHHHAPTHHHVSIHYDVPIHFSPIDHAHIYY